MRPSTTWRVLSEIHSSFTASLLRGRMRITSRAAAVDADGGAERVHDVDRFGLPHSHGRALCAQGRCVSAPTGHRSMTLADSSDISRLLEVGGDLHVLAAADDAELLDAGDLRHEADAARAVDAARHDRLDERPEVLVLDGALVLAVTRAAHAERHRLVLQVALAALVADRAVERMIDQQEFHHAFARLLDQRRLGVDDLRRVVPVGRKVVDAHGARGDGLRHALHLDQAHAAVAGDRQALVVAEARNLGASLLAGLKHGDAVLDLDLLAVDDELLGHVSRCL